MDASELIKVAEDDPRRCQSSTKLGQCRNQAIENSINCPIHICAHHSTINNNKNRILDLTRWRDKVHRNADHTGITSLREEVGVLRLLLVTLLESCETEVDLITHHNPISELTLKIQRLVKDLHSLDKSTGNLLDKSTVLHLAANIITIVEKYVSDKNILSAMSDELIKLIENALPNETND